MGVYNPTAVELGTGITIPASGEDIDAADVNVPICAIADGVKFVGDKLKPATRLVNLNGYFGRTTTPDTISPAHASSIHNRGFTSLDAWPLSAGILTVSVVTASSSAYIYGICLDPFLVDGATLASATLRLAPNPTHAALPVLMPELAVTRTPRTGVTTSASESLLSTNNGWKIDTSATFGAFNLEHDIALVCNAVNVIDLDAFSYGFYFHDEGGVNALASSTPKNVALAFTYP
jgi:hypothetical protein